MFHHRRSGVSPQACLTVLLVTALAACGGGDGGGHGAVDNTDATQAEANYSTVAPIEFALQGDDGSRPQAAQSSEARVFYSYHPAIGGPLGKPLFVMLNGGPGCATTTNLFSMNTAPYTLDMLRTGTDTTHVENPYSWTHVGNLLYIDAPNSGFSYGVIRPNDEFMRALDFTVSYNPFVDAAQVIRVILGFLADHPPIQGNPVILVGESYGGTRVSTMLNLLLYHRRYADGRAVYQDPALVAAIEGHLAATAPPGSEPPYPPAIVAAQFGRQILIQPELSGPYQNEATGELYERPGSVIDSLVRPGSPEYQRCAFTGCDKAAWALAQVQYVFNRDRYIYTRPSTWSDDLEAHAMDGLLDVNVLSTVLGVNVREITLMRPEARNGKGAYRYLLRKGLALTNDIEYLQQQPGYTERLSSREQQTMAFGAVSQARIAAQLRPVVRRSLPVVLGELDPVDDYLVGTNYAVYFSFMYNLFTLAGIDLNPERSPRYGALFLENLALVETFMTDAQLDLVIYPQAIPPALERYLDVVRAVETHWGTGATDGAMTVFYQPDSLPEVETPESRTIFMPHYAESGHSVSSTQPDKLLADVQTWLQRR